MRRNSSFSQSLKRISPWLALSCSALLYVLHFFAGGGNTKLITDSAAYLLMAQGELLGAPYSSRVLEPFIVSIISSAFGISNLAAFQILTPVALLASLLLLRKAVSDHGGSAEWQAAVLLALGCGLAVTFGYTPVMIDPLLLFFACLTVVTLDRGHFGAAVLFASLAALTKEYGLLLGLVSCLYAYRRGNRRLAWAAFFVPLIIFLVVTLTRAGSPGVGLQRWTSFLSAMFGYHTYLFHFRGATEYPKLLYMWLWSAIWPALAIAAGVVLVRVRHRVRMRDHEIAFATTLIALPFLLLGDWGRALLIVVPFACTVATTQPLARDPRFVTLLAVGGLATALARPFHSEPPPPQALTLIMTIISVSASLLIGISILRFAVTKSAPRIDREVNSPSPEAALP